MTTSEGDASRQEGASGQRYATAPLETWAPPPPQEWGEMRQVYRHDLQRLQKDCGGLRKIARPLSAYFSLGLLGLGVAGSGFTGLVTYYGAAESGLSPRVATFYWCLLAGGAIAALIFFIVAYLGRTTYTDAIQEVVDELKRIEYESERSREP